MTTANLTATPPILEPMLISSMRTNTTGTIRYSPSDGRGGLGTSATGFLNEVDSWRTMITDRAAAEALVEAANDFDLQGLAGGAALRERANILLGTAGTP